MQPAVAYYRVSTERQRRSGLGIEAQQAAVARFAETAGFTLTAHFVEAASGKGADALERRPQLALALSTARSKRCPVIVAKLDRLSRNVALPPIPIVLFDEKFWREVVSFDALVKHGVVSKSDLGLFSFAEDPEEAWAALVKGGVMEKWLQEQHTT
jgi:hypothetical protein